MMYIFLIRLPHFLSLFGKKDGITKDFMTPMIGNNIIYKPKLSEDIKAVLEETVHAKRYMVTKV